MDYNKTAQQILHHVGGANNVESVVHCATRLRFRLKHPTQANIAVLKKIPGVIMALESAGQLQVIIGNNVELVYKKISPLLKSDSPSNATSKTEVKKHPKNILTIFIELVSEIFIPIIGVMTASGIIKGLLAFSLATHLITESSGTYQLLYISADALFFFLPIFLGYTSAKKFGANPILIMAIGAALVHPIAQEQFKLVFNAELTHTSPTILNFLGIPIDYINYATSVIPIIFSAWIASKLEKFFARLFHSSIRHIFNPVCCLIIVVPLTFLVIGPTANFIAKGLASGYSMLYTPSPIICGFILGGLWQILVIFGLHWGLFPLTQNNIMTLGRDSLVPLLMPAVMAQVAATFAILFKSKDPSIKSLSASATLSGIFGVTEPAVYGLTLPRKLPFIFGCLGGAIGGAIVGYYHSAIYSIGLITIFSFVQIIPPTGIDSSVIGVIIASVVGAFISFMLTLLFYKEDKFLATTHHPDSPQPATNDSSLIPSIPVVKTESYPCETLTKMSTQLKSPFTGTLIPTNDIPDASFSSEIMGKTLAIAPLSDQLLAPLNGEVVAITNTKHAISIMAENGAEILIHIGIDTVKLQGEPFTLHVTVGQQIKEGDCLVSFDRQLIESAGLSLITPIIITNSDEYEIVPSKLSGAVNALEPLLSLSKI